MNFARLLPVLFLTLLVAPFASAADKPQPTRKVLYKTAGEVPLHLHVFEPANHQANQSRPAIVFFFGGGWVGGSPSQFYPQSAALAELGMVAFCAEYRVKSRNGTTPFECVKDGKSAIRWVRTNARKLGIDPDRIVAAGGSAGGHVAACTGTIDGFEEENEETSVSSRPNAMVLFNPVIDTSRKGYGYNTLKQRFREISPVEHVDGDVPPTIIFQGTADTTTPPLGAQRFAAAMKKSDRRCELKEFEGQKHGFFNRGESYEQTLAMTKQFLADLGYVKGVE